jgi:hypothetical protein
MVGQMSIVRLMPAAALVALLAGSAVAAEERPQLRPTRDVDVTYRVIRAHDPATWERVRWSAAKRLERVDGPDRAVTIFDRVGSEITLLNPRRHTYRKLEGASHSPIEPEQGAALKRGAASKILGLPCTDWSWLANDETHTVCMTPDGLALRVAVDGKTVMQAVSVRYRPQGAELFEIPAHYAPALAPEGGPEP